MSRHASYMALIVPVPDTINSPNPFNTEDY